MDELREPLPDTVIKHASGKNEDERHQLQDSPPRLYDIIAELASDVSIDEEVHDAHLEQLLDLEYALSMQQYMTASTLASVLRKLQIISVKLSNEIFSAGTFWVTSCHRTQTQRL